MRKIKTFDVFKLARIIKLSGAKDELSTALRATQEPGGASGAGIELLMTLVIACADQQIEDAFYDLVGDIAEEKPDKIKNMDLEELTTTFKEISEQNNLTVFFDAAVKSA